MMTYLPASLAIGGSVGATLVFADVVSGATIGVKDALAMVIFVAGLVWWLGRELKGIKDSQRVMRDDIKAIKAKVGMSGPRSSDKEENDK